MARFVFTGELRGLLLWVTRDDGELGGSPQPEPEAGRAVKRRGLPVKLVVGRR